MVKMAEGGLLLEVYIPWPSAPKPPENLAKAPEEEKNEYHQRTVAFCDAHREVEKVRLGRVVLEQPGELLADCWKRDEEASWEAYQAALEGEEEVP